jgi:hypothetical protein
MSGRAQSCAVASLEVVRIRFWQGRTGAMSPSGRQFRFAILCESACLEAWQEKCLDLLLQSGCAQLVLVVINARGRKAWQAWRGMAQLLAATSGTSESWRSPSTLS